MTASITHDPEVDVRASTGSEKGPLRRSSANLGPKAAGLIFIQLMVSLANVAAVEGIAHASSVSRAVPDQPRRYGTPCNEEPSQPAWQGPFPVHRRYDREFTSSGSGVPSANTPIGRCARPGRILDGPARFDGAELSSPVVALAEVSGMACGEIFVRATKPASVAIVACI
jgi:hypothetical protein